MKKLPSEEKLCLSYYNSEHILQYVITMDIRRKFKRYDFDGKEYHLVGEDDSPIPLQNMDKEDVPEKPAVKKSKTKGNKTNNG